MKLSPFKLERYFAKYEFSARHLLSSSDCDGLLQKDVLALADDETRRLWEDPERNEWVLGRTPKGRWGELSELKGTVVYLASEASDFVTGVMINVDGGWIASYAAGGIFNPALTAQLRA